MKESTILFALIRYVMNGTEISDEIKNAITPETLYSLYKLAKKHDLAHLIAKALEKNGIFADAEMKKKYLQERNMAIYRYEQMRYELDCIKETLRVADVPFVVLKGSVLRDFYPEAWMRTSCDIDLLVHEQDLERAAAALKEEHGYSCAAQKTVNELSLYSISGVHLELHYDLSEGNQYGEEVLSNIWQYTLPSDTNDGSLCLTDSAFYFYHIAHMVKHFEYGGCGIRSFLDLWLMNKKVQYDKAELAQLLKNSGFLQFAEACEKLASVWFDGAENDEIGERLQEYILEGGVFGTLHSSLGMQHAKKGGRFKYFMSRIFISNKELRVKYPQLENRPWLVPIYHVRRWFKPVLQKESSKHSKSLVRESSNVSVAEKKNNEWLLRNLGLK